ESLQNNTNNFGVLRWKFGKPSAFADFLDLNIQIKSNVIKTNTYQKPINLNQYIPPSLAHPPNIMSGIVDPLVKNNKRQNSKQQDYNGMAVKLFHRHAARGWALSTMKQYILDSHRKLSSYQALASYQPASLPPSPTKKTVSTLLIPS
ncbi:hypothetical protein ACHAWF_003842, partial [Thalassiosira exigua]